MTLQMLPLDSRKILEGILIAGDGHSYDDYIDNVRQDSGGYAYEALLPEVNYEKVFIKIPGEKKPTIIYGGKPIPVVVEGGKVKAYQNFRRGGEIALSIYADKISVEKTNLRINKGE